MHPHGPRLRSTPQKPKALISNAIMRTNTVAVYTKHQRLHEHEFAIHTRWSGIVAGRFYDVTQPRFSQPVSATRSRFSMPFEPRSVWTCVDISQLLDASTKPIETPD